MKDFLYLHLRDLPYFRALIRSVEASFYQQIELPAPTLDLGCGDGHFAGITFDRPIEVGLDPWWSPIREAGRRGCYRQLIQASGESIPYPDGYFSSAMSNSVLEHIQAIDPVLAETARVLKPRAPFIFCVPNERYLAELSISRVLGKGYTEWFRRVSRVQHADPPSIWQARLDRAGFDLERWWHYFSPPAMRMLEWGHYFGLPSLLARKVFGRWILVPQKWNLWITEKIVRKYAAGEPVADGTFTFYISKRKA